MNPSSSSVRKAAVSALLLPLLFAAGASAVTVPPGLHGLAAATHVTAVAFGPEGTLWDLESHSPGMYEAPEVSLTARSGEGAVVGAVTPVSPDIPFATAPGAAWYLDGGLVRGEPGAGATTFRLPQRIGAIEDLAVGPEGSVWFTSSRPDAERTNAAIGRLTAQGELTRFPLGRYAEPTQIIAGPDGNIWFLVSGLEGRAPALARITPAGKVTRFPLPSSGPESGYGNSGGVGGLAAGPGGDLWVGDGVALGRRPHARIAKVTPLGRVTVYPVPGTEPPLQLTSGPSGLLWFATRTARGLGIDSLAPDGRVGIPTCIQPEAAYCELTPYSLAGDPAGNLWVAAGRSTFNCGGGGACEFSAASIEQESGYLGILSPPASAVAR